MIDIFYKSYAKDFKWLYYSLASVAKFVSGYNRVVVVVPERDKHQLNFDVLPPRFQLHFVDERTSNFHEGYLYQQWIKMSAHNYCAADYIMYADSDLIFNKKVNVLDLLSEGKPTILYTDYEKVGEAICWKAPTDRFMNAKQKYEFMRRLPLIYRRDTVQKINQLEPKLQDIIMNSERFSEFNAMGAWAFAHEKDKYNFINTDDWEFQENIADQFWSHSGLTAEDEKKLKEIFK